MRAVRFHEYGGPDVLTVDEIRRPEIGADEVLVEVEAAAVNPVDTYFREGGYEPGDLPWIPGSDCAGTVAAVGESVSEYAEGDRVFATGLGNWLQGTCAEYAAVPESYLAHLPEGVDFETGAAVALVGVTAWESLVAACSLNPAERALIHGGSGGVGHVAVQLAAANGARVTTTASPTYHDRLRELGADDVLDYSRDDLADAVVAAGRPDVILDHRLDDYLSFDAEVAAQGGRVAAIGNSDAAATFESVPNCRSKSLSVHHVLMFNAPDFGGVLASLATLLEDGDLTAEVAQTYNLAEVADAHRDVLEESFLGKLVVTP
ncbi:NADPH:quinone reductase [Haloarcula nitratireducens]|uniref:NADPH:quinone reductase n=1 Tax=Haloarcula nitratireducens TaxID=2487749 RepID=A0AAW4P751_9EURY|nr:NADPH:quinone reductase [Halomicroarcula nitratireducens]MBX0293760.1 NADPH:quinone reductase [Halomicroarcula nitratireducens]